jgi:hypothetical protein
MWKKKNVLIRRMNGNTYEERSKDVGNLTLEERRHQADMVQDIQNCYRKRLGEQWDLV